LGEREKSHEEIIEMSFDEIIQAYPEN